MTKYRVEIKDGDSWKAWGGETFEFRTNAELQALTLQDNFRTVTRVVPVEG